MAPLMVTDYYYLSAGRKSICDFYGDLSGEYHPQVNAELPFELDVVFESGSNDDTDEELSGEAYGHALEERVKAFQVVNGQMPDICNR